ncbi:MAG: hypothetical protein AB1942_17095 [Pseudomonadota bacterium]
MPKSGRVVRIVTAPALAAIALLAAPASAQTADKQPISVTNAMNAVAHCTFLVEGRVRTYLEIRPGKTWSEEVDPRRLYQLVCMRGKENSYRLEPGKPYRVEAVGRKVGLVAAAD